MFKWIILLVVSFTLLLISCENKGSEQRKSIETVNAGSESQIRKELVEYDLAENKSAKKVTKSGYIKFKNNNLDIVKSIVDSLIQQNQAYVTDEKYEKINYGTYNFKIRIPFKNYDYFISKLKIIFGQPLNSLITFEDFSSEYTDNEIRLTSKKAYLQRCLELLKKANKIQDLLDIEEKVSEIQQDIDRLSGNQKKYDFLSNYYSLDIDFITDEYQHKADEESYFSKLWHSLGKGWSGIGDLILQVISIWHVILLLAIIFYFMFKYIRKSQKFK